MKSYEDRKVCCAIMCSYFCQQKENVSLLLCFVYLDFSFFSFFFLMVMLENCSTGLFNCSHVFPQKIKIGSHVTFPLKILKMSILEVLNLSHLTVTFIRYSRVDKEDKWSWTLSPDGWYSVKSAYSSLLRGLPATGASEGDTLQAVSRIWKAWVPSKVVVFSWQLLLDRIPTRLNLIRRGVPLPNGGLGCAFCETPSESSVHLFLSCPSILPVWYQVATWLGWEFVIPLGLARQFQYFTGLGASKRVRLGLLLVCHAVIWIIWTSRNDLMFFGGAIGEEPVVDRAKLLTWKWFLAKCPASSCTYHEWKMQPILCWQR